MTTITEKDGMIKVNGRSVYVSGVKSVEKTGSYSWVVTRIDGQQIKVFGGTAAGGGRNDWWMSWEHAFGDYQPKYNSAAACLRAIDRV